MNTISIIPVMQSIKAQLKALRTRHDDTFSNVSAFNPMSRIKIQTELPRMQETLRGISLQLCKINTILLKGEECALYNEIISLYNDLKEDLF